MDYVVYTALINRNMMTLGFIYRYQTVGKRLFFCASFSIPFQFLLFYSLLNSLLTALTLLSSAPLISPPTVPNSAPLPAYSSHLTSHRNLSSYGSPCSSRAPVPLPAFVFSCVWHDTSSSSHTFAATQTLDWKINAARHWVCESHCYNL